MIRMSRVFSPLRICRVSVSPSMPGSWMSIKITRGSADSIAAIASPAFVAMRTSYPFDESTNEISLMFVGLSSTIRTTSPAMSLLSGHASLDGREERAQLLQDRGSDSGALADDPVGRRSQADTLVAGEVLRGPDEHRDT